MLWHRAIISLMRVNCEDVTPLSSWVHSWILIPRRASWKTVLALLRRTAVWLLSFHTFIALHKNAVKSLLRNAVARMGLSILFCFIFNNNQAAKETYVRRLWSRRRRESYYGTSFLFTRRAIGVFEREIMLRKGHTIILEIIEESPSVFYDLFMRNHSRWNAFL